MAVDYNLVAVPLMAAVPLRQLNTPTAAVEHKRVCSFPRFPKLDLITNHHGSCP